MRAVVTASLLILAGVSSFAKERPDPAKNEWLMKPTVGLDVVDYDTAVKSIPRFSASAKRNKGVYVLRVRPFSSADVAGVQVADLITKVGGKEVGTAAEFDDAIANAKSGATVRMAVKAIADGQKELNWKASKTINMGVVSSGRLARISVKVTPDPVTGIGAVTIREHRRVAPFIPFSVLFTVDGEGYATAANFHLMYEQDRIQAEEVRIGAGENVHRLKIPKDVRSESVEKTGHVIEHATWPITDQKVASAFRDCIDEVNVVFALSGKDSQLESKLEDEHRWNMQIMWEAYESLKYGDLFKITDKEH